MGSLILTLKDQVIIPVEFLRHVMISRIHLTLKQTITKDHPLKKKGVFCDRNIIGQGKLGDWKKLYHNMSIGLITFRYIPDRTNPSVNKNKIYKPRASVEETTLDIFSTHLLLNKIIIYDQDYYVCKMKRTL